MDETGLMFLSDEVRQIILDALCGHQIKLKYVQLAPYRHLNNSVVRYGSNGVNIPGAMGNAVQPVANYGIIRKLSPRTYQFIPNDPLPTLVFFNARDVVDIDTAWFTNDEDENLLFPQIILQRG